MSRPVFGVPMPPSSLGRLPAFSPGREIPDFEGVALVLAQMTPGERVRAYASGVFTLRELNGAAGVRPDLMPIVNGEYEWIALTMADLD